MLIETTVKTRKKALWSTAAAAILAAAGSTGCGASMMEKMDVRDDLVIWEKEHPTVDKLPARQASIEVSVAVSPNLALPPPAPGGKEDSVPLDLAGGPEDLEAYDADLKKKSMFRTVLMGAGDAVVVILRHHLERYFDRVKVTETPSPPEGAGPTVHVAGRLHTTTFRSAVLLALSTPETGGKTLSARAETESSSSAPHLVWVIPVVLAHGLLTGAFIVGPILRSIHKGKVEHQYIASLDQACAELAKQLASAPAAPVALLSDSRK